MQSPDIKVASNGDYDGVVSPDRFVANVGSETAELARDFAPEGEAPIDLVAVLGRSVERLSTPYGVVVKTEEDYALTTATWIGATLDQGVWYEMSAQLLMPGTAVLIDHDIAFAFTRSLPCTRGAAASSCAEIIVHASPNSEALKTWQRHVSANFALPPESFHYSSTTDLRLVTDPRRLLPYVSDLRRSWYIAEAADKGDPVIGSERIVTRTNYR
jgi:hypothetical protein